MIVPQAIAEILGIKNVQTIRELADYVAHGLPKKSAERLSIRIFISRGAARTYQHTLIPLATYKRRVGSLTATESERVERIARVLAHAEMVWDDREDARSWMLRQHPEIANKTPLDMASTELGARQVEELLDRLFYGLPV